MIITFFPVLDFEPIDIEEKEDPSKEFPSQELINADSVVVTTGEEKDDTAVEVLISDRMDDSQIFTAMPTNVRYNI